MLPERRGSALIGFRRGAGAQIIIEGQSGGRSGIGHEDAEAMYTGTDLIDPGFHDELSQRWSHGWSVFPCGVIRGDEAPHDLSSRDLNRNISSVTRPPA